MSTHIRTDDEWTNDKRTFACGIGPALPEGDLWVHDTERGLHDLVDCPGCTPFRAQLGTPISQLSGRPGHSGFDRFCQIAREWGYD